MQLHMFVPELDSYFKCADNLFSNHLTDINVLFDIPQLNRQYRHQRKVPQAGAEHRVG